MSIANAAHCSMIGGGKALPYKKRLEYISSTGSQYINTGWTPTTTAKISLDCYILSYAPNNVPQVGCIQNGGKPYYNYSWSGSYPNGKLHMYFGYRSDSLYGSFSLDNVTTGGTRGRSVISYDGANGIASAGTHTISCPVANSVPAVPFYLFARNNRGTAELKATMRIYGFVVEDGGEKTIDMIPVLDLNGEPKLFDQVSQTYPAHYGTFTPGPEI